jgi:hypothetical protein
MSVPSPQRRTFVFAFAALAWFSVLLQCCLSMLAAAENGRTLASGMVGFLGYFTVLTNLLVCTSLTLPLIAPRTSLGRFFSRPDVTARVATSIAFVGLAYHFLLRNSWNPQGLQLLATILLHYVIPVLYLVHWWFDSPKASLRWILPVVWGVYPTVYLFYALLRGRLIGSYPYAFIDAAAIGYGRTMINGVGLLFAFIVLGLLVAALDRARVKGMS